MNRTIWQQIVDAKQEWIGGKFGENDPMFGTMEGIIKDIELKKLNPTDEHPTFFITGEEGEDKHPGFSCNIEYHGFSAGYFPAPSSALCISGFYAGAGTFWIDKPTKE